MGPRIESTKAPKRFVSGTQVGIMQGRLKPPRLDRFQLFPSRDWREELKCAEELGFRRFELLDDKGGSFRRLMVDENFWQTLSHCSLVVESVCADALCCYSLCDSPSAFLRSLDELLRLESRKIKLVVLPFFDQNAVDSRERLRQALKQLKISKLDNAFANAGIRLALELQLSAEIVVEELRQSQLRGVGICYDIGNATAAGFSPERELTLLADLLFHIHIKDRRPSGESVLLGEGAVNFEVVLRALFALGYGDSLILETRYRENPVEEARRNRSYLLAKMAEAREAT